MQRKVHDRRRPIPAGLPEVTRAALRWFRRHARDLPWRRTHDPYAIWVAEIMLQQTQVKTVIPYWNRWMRALPTIRALARARPEKVLKLWEGLGYYRRARNLHDAARLLVRERGGLFPVGFDEVLALPGIGPYTAGAICSIAYNQPTPVLDGNVARVLSRVFGIGGDATDVRTKGRLWFLAERLVRLAADEPARGRRNCSDLNQALMELGAVTCTPGKPRCQACPLRSHCAAFRSPARSTVTLRSRRPKPTTKRVLAFVVERNGRFLVRRRPANLVNGGLWEFPNSEVTGGSGAWRRALRALPGRSGQDPERLLRVEHSITRYRITLDVYRVRTDDDRLVRISGGRWCSLNELRRRPFSSAHRRIVEHLARGPRR